MRSAFVRQILIAALAAASGIACKSERPNIEKTTAQVERWADQLDAQTTEAGVYVRHKGDTLDEKDAWGRALTIAYSQGGMAETLTIRSFGPDGESHSKDDIVAKRSVTNLRGVGVGLQKGIGKTASEGAKGIVEGTAAGVRGLIRRDKAESTSPTQAVESK